MFSLEFFLKHLPTVQRFYLALGWTQLQPTSPITFQQAVALDIQGFVPTHQAQ